MPSTRSSSGGVLKPIADTSNLNPPVTPGTKVRQLEAKLNEMDAENEALRMNLNDLTKAFGKLNVVKDVTVTQPENADQKKAKKDKNAPVQNKTAYKFFCEELTTDISGKDRQKAWKECAPEVRSKFESLAQADKARYEREMAAYKDEQLGLELLRGKKEQEEAMELYKAHIAAQQHLAQAEGDKKGKKKKVKDEDAPKRPMSSYMYFAAEKRASVVAKNPNAAPTEIAKILGTMWNKLDKTKGGARGGKKYEEMAEKDRARYQDEKATYDAMIAERNAKEEEERLARLEAEKKEAQSLLQEMRNSKVGETVGADGMSVVSAMTGESQKRKKKDPNAPKKAKNAYNCFIQKHFASAKAEMSAESSANDVMKALSEQWKQLAQDDKLEYEQIAAADRERYSQEMAEYEAKN